MTGRGRDTISESVRATLYATAGASEVEAFEVPDDRWAQIPALGLVSPADRRRLPAGRRRPRAGAGLISLRWNFAIHTDT